MQSCSPRDHRLGLGLEALVSAVFEINQLFTSNVMLNFCECWYSLMRVFIIVNYTRTASSQ